MSINDFFNEPKFKRFQKYIGDKTLENLYEYLENKTTVTKMIDSTKNNKPALLGIIKEIEENYIPKLKIKKDDSLKKQLIGSMISFILAEYGYENTGNSKTLGKYDFFSVAACYKKVKYNPFDNTKELKTIKNFGRSNDVLFVDEFDDYIGNDESQLTYKKVFQLLSSDNNISNMIKYIENNSAPIDYATEIISEHWPELENQGGSSGYIFDLCQGQIIFEAIIEQILSSIQYKRDGYIKSKYFPQAVKYIKSNLPELTIPKTNHNYSDKCCYICKDKITNDQPYLKLFMFVNENSLKHENIKFSYPKLCAKCCQEIKHFKNLFNNINVEQIKNDSNFLFELPSKVIACHDLEDYFSQTESPKKIELQKEIEELKKRIKELENPQKKGRN